MSMKIKKVDPDSNNYKVYEIAHLVFLTVEGFLWLVVDTLFLVFFLKYSRKLTTGQKEDLET